MSAFLVTSDHIAILASYAAMHDAVYRTFCQHGNGHTETAERLAERLAKANMQSMMDRYGDEGCGDPDAYLRDCIAKVRKYIYRTPVDHLDIWGMVGCFEYQACEADGWMESAARTQCEWIKDAAIRKHAASKGREIAYAYRPAQEAA